MPYNYAPKTVFFNKILEYIAWFCLLPLYLGRSKIKSPIKKIILIEPFQMGDVLSLCPMIQPLQKQYPEIQLFILTKPSSGTIFKYDKRITEVFTVDFPWSDYGEKKANLKRYRQLFSYLWQLRKQKFDIGIDTRGDIRSQLVLKLINCKQVVGYTHYLGSNIRLKGLLLDKKLSQSPFLHRYDWNNFLLTTLGIAAEELYPAQLPCFLPETTWLTTPEKFILLHIGGGWEFKRWQEEKWVQLIEQINLKVSHQIIVIGGKSEQPLVENIKKKIPENTKIQYKITTIEEIIQLTQHCLFLISLDSGPMNLAVCLGKKVVALFGPGDSTMWYPYSTQSQWIHKKEAYTCNPCFQTTCYFAQKSCMASIEVAEVLSLVNNFLE